MRLDKKEEKEQKIKGEQWTVQRKRFNQLGCGFGNEYDSLKANLISLFKSSSLNVMSGTELVVMIGGE